MRVLRCLRRVRKSLVFPPLSGWWSFASALNFCLMTEGVMGEEEEVEEAMSK